MKKFIILFSLLCLFLTGCTSDNPNLDNGNNGVTPPEVEEPSNIISLSEVLQYINGEKFNYELYFEFTMTFNEQHILIQTTIQEDDNIVHTVEETTITVGDTVVKSKEEYYDVYFEDRVETHTKTLTGEWETTISYEEEDLDRLPEFIYEEQDFKLVSNGIYELNGDIQNQSKTFLNIDLTKAEVKYITLFDEMKFHKFGTIDLELPF